MSWKIHFYDDVEDSILTMPPKIQARIIKLLELMEKHGAHLGPPHTEAIGNGLFEIRAKAQEGIVPELILLPKRPANICIACLCEKITKNTEERIRTR